MEIRTVSYNHIFPELDAAVDAVLRKHFDSICYSLHTQPGGA